MTDPLRRAGARVLVPLGYLALAIAASWPLARDFAAHTIGDVYCDERHAIWMLWYTAQALAGQVSWPHTTHLLWPHGISVLVDGVGPLNGVLALPFWPWGAAAAFNGVALVGLQNGNQFVFAALGLALIAVQTWLATPRGGRSARARRIALAGAASIASPARRSAPGCVPWATATSSCTATRA